MAGLGSCHSSQRLTNRRILIIRLCPAAAVPRQGETAGRIPFDRAIAPLRIRSPTLRTWVRRDGVGCATSRGADTSSGFVTGASG